VLVLVALVANGGEEILFVLLDLNELLVGRSAAGQGCGEREHNQDAEHGSTPFELR
jgi:hypothetical protein